MSTTRTDAAAAAEAADATYRATVTAADEAYRRIANRARVERNAARKIAEAAYNDITRAAKREYDAAVGPADKARRAAWADRDAQVQA